MELLVHVSAASSKRDDDRYKRQARAYPGLEVAHSIPTSHGLGAESRELRGLRQHGPAILSDAAQSHPWSPHLFLDDTQLARTALESQLITSSLQQEPDPLTPYIIVPSEGSIALEDGSLQGHTQHHSTWTTNGASTRERTQRNAHTHGGHQYIVSTSHVPELAIGDAHPEQPRISISTPAGRLRSISVLERRASLSSSGDDIPSQLPSTYSLSDVTSRSSHQQDQPQLSSPVLRNVTTPVRNIYRNLNGRSFPAHTTSSSLLFASTCRPGQSTLKQLGNSRPNDVSSPLDGLTSPVPQLCMAIEEDATHGEEAPVRGPLPMSSTDIAGLPVPASITTNVEGYKETPRCFAGTPVTCVLKENQGPKVAQSVSAMLPLSRYSATKASLREPRISITPEEISTIRTLPTSVCPGPPPTSSEPFVSHVTPDLLKLYKNADLSLCYQPRQILRPIRQSERGHWLVDSSGWPAGLQIAFWKFLERQIGCEKAGWGVWCTRELDHQEDDSGVHETRRAYCCIGQVKVFCWGEIVQHVYMMLFVASKSKVKRDNPAWIDAGGEIVVQM